MFKNLIYGELPFEISREGLTELSAILEPLFDQCGPEVQNYINEVRNTLQRMPPVVTQEESWLDV